MRRTKFNVDKNKDKRTHDGIVFASELEMKYYRDVLTPAYQNGEIKYYELQKKYELQPGFKRNGKAVLPIIYKADFYIEYSNGSIEVIDTKGHPDNVAALKRKMFWFCYPDINYRWIVYVRKYGGWIDYELAQKFRREAKRKEKKERNYNDKD